MVYVLGLLIIIVIILILLLLFGIIIPGMWNEEE